MRRKINAEFDTFDLAENAAYAVRRSSKGAKIQFIRPDHPESIRLSRSLRKRFTLLPTAIASMNYITALTETDYNYEDLNEVQKRQTSTIQLICDEGAAHAAEAIIIQKGGTILPPS
ncbi:MAG: hypothetical protein IJY74_05000 [Oscillospiraceae bacterium]|nr:hypothetical protein [Oscillospiraceae bacterium]